jgi:hypothetical protein
MEAHRACPLDYMRRLATTVDPYKNLTIFSINPAYSLIYSAYLELESCGGILCVIVKLDSLKVLKSFFDRNKFDFKN